MAFLTTILAALKFRAGAVAVQKVPSLVFRAQVDAETVHRARVNTATTHRIRVDVR